MENNKRLQDLTQVFDSRWNADKGRKEFLDERKEHMKRMFNIQDKQDYRKEILRANSVNGRIENLNDKMGAANNMQRMDRLNNFKNNFK